MDHFEELDIEKEKITTKKDSVHVRSEEMKNCTFCGLRVLKKDMLKHTESHMENWGGEQLIIEEGDNTNEPLDENTKLMDDEVIKEEIVENEIQMCSFCPELIEKDKMRDHINEHVAQWGNDTADIVESHVENCGGEELKGDKGDNIEESSDENTELMNEEEVVENESLKCSFCPELIEKDRMRDHINTHVEQWSTNTSASEELLSADNFISDKDTDDEFAESPTEKVVIEKSGGKYETEESETKSYVICSFCNDNIKRKDIQHHTEQHVASWDNNSEKEISVEQEESMIDNKPSHVETKSETIEEEVDTVKCSFCPEYVSRDNIFEHINNHSLQWKNDLEISKEEKSPEKEKNKCKHCGKCLRYKHELEEHERVHTGEKPLHCSYCAKTFRAKFGLAQHVRNKHTMIANCHQCGKTFSEQRTLKKHLSKVHGQDDGVKCKQCDELFPSQISLDKHQKNSCYRHVCTTCGKMFKQKCNLDSHLITHKEAEEAKILVCAECGKKYSRQSILDEHIRTHSNKKEFKCERCGKGFNRKSGRWCHKKYWCHNKQDME